MIRVIALNRWTVGFCFVFGLALAGSDGPWFPWPNVIGVLIFFYFGIAARMVERTENEIGSIHHTRGYQMGHAKSRIVFRRRDRVPAAKTTYQNQKIIQRI